MKSSNACSATCGGGGGGCCWLSSIESKKVSILMILMKNEIV
jgi:hypothetical protein